MSTLPTSVAAAVEGLQTVHDTIVEHPDRWTQGTSFRDQDGAAVRHPEQACSGCLYGLIRVALPDAPTRVLARTALEREVADLTKTTSRPGLNVPDWQDRAHHPASPGRTVTLPSFLKPPTGGPRFFSPAPPTRAGSGARRKHRTPVHEFDARMNARPHTTRLLVQAMKGPGDTTNAAGASTHHTRRSL